MFLCDAFFNRKLNLSHLPKTNTSFAHIKAGVKRGRDALDDLRKITRDNNEGAYLMNPRTGKVGKYVQGDEDSVDIFDNLKYY